MDLLYPTFPDTPTSHLPFSPAVVAGGLIFVSGQASVDAKGQIVSDTFEGEFRRSVENLRRVLKAAGSDLRHVVQTRNYVRDPANIPLFNTLYREYFSAPFPARTTITHCLPPVLHFEIECIAVPGETIPAASSQ
jgi:2-iminobutanoate/2-iminopropanoate deaminase